MPINVTHGDIGAAMRLAAKAGEGEDWWRRYAAGQGVLERLNREAAQVQQAAEGRTRTALAYDKMAQQQRQFGEQMSQQRAIQEAQTTMRGEELAVGRQERGAQFALQERQQAERERATAESERVRRERQEAYKKTSEYKEYDRSHKALKEKVTQARKYLEAAADPISKKMGGIDSWEPSEELSPEAKRLYIKMRQQYMDASQNLADMDYQDQFGPGSLRTTGADMAPRAVGPAAGPDEIAEYNTTINQLANGILQQITRAERTPEDVREFVETILRGWLEDDQVTPMLVDAVTAQVLQLRGGQ